jgi:hypothetical protein
MQLHHSADTAPCSHMRHSYVSIRNYLLTASHNILRSTIGRVGIERKRPVVFYSIFLTNQNRLSWLFCPHGILALLPRIQKGGSTSFIHSTVPYSKDGSNDKYISLFPSLSLSPLTPHVESFARLHPNTKSSSHCTALSST